MGRCCIPQALVQERLEQQGPYTISVPPLPPVTLCKLSSLTVAGRGLEIHSRMGQGKRQAGMISAADCSLSSFLGKISDYLTEEEDGELLLLCPHCTKKRKPTEIPHSLAALKTPFTSLLCGIPKHNKDYLKSESSLKIKTTQREKKEESGGRGQSPSPAGPWSEASKTAHTASCSTAQQSIAFTRQT